MIFKQIKRANKALHRTAIPLRSITAGEFYRCKINDLKIDREGTNTFFFLDKILIFDNMLL